MIAATLLVWVIYGEILIGSVCDETERSPLLSLILSTLAHIRLRPKTDPDHVWSHVDPKLGYILSSLAPTVVRWTSHLPFLPWSPRPSPDPANRPTWLRCIEFHAEIHVRAVVRAANKTLFSVDDPSSCREVYRPRVIRANFTSRRAPPPLAGFPNVFATVYTYYTGLLIYFREMYV